jgi:integrase
MDFFTNTHLNPKTYKPYNSKLNKWIALMPPDKNNIQYILTHPNFSVVTLRKHLSENNTNTFVTLHSYLKAILSCIDHNPHFINNLSQEELEKITSRWREMMSFAFKQSTQYRLEQKPSPTQALKGGSSLKLSDIRQKYDELENKSIEKLLIAFYIDVPPVRADHYATEILKFGEIPSQPNYIFINDSKAYLKITDFKTSNIWKSIDYDLPPELHKLLTLSLTEFPRKYLFTNEQGKPFNRDSFSKWASMKLTRLFKKEFTLTMFRHIYISDLDPNTPTEILYDISRKMGHSLTQQILYRWKEENQIVDE